MGRTRKQSDDNTKIKQEEKNKLVNDVKGEQSKADFQESEKKKSNVTDYERKRLENIQRNLEFMKSMGVSTAKMSARTAIATAVPASTNKKRESKVSIELPRRKSARIQGKKPENPEGVGSNRLLNSLRLREGNAAFDREQYSEDAEGNKLALASMLGDRDARDDEFELAVDGSGMELVEYTLNASKDIIKAVHERVYSATFHPRADRIIVACGDKGGMLALWSPDAKSDVLATFRPHKQAVTKMHFVPTNSNKLITSSFDGTVQEFDLQQIKFATWFDVEDQVGVTSIAIRGTHTDHYLASTDDGSVFILDRRVAPNDQSGFGLHEKKINTVHQHPTIEHCFATSSLDRTVCLWDARQLRPLSSPSLLVLPHHRSVNCAYFSPHGQYLVTVGLDDYLHIYNTSDIMNSDETKPTLRVPHNNQTGRWLTKFHATWDPKRPDQYLMGCLQQPRRLQIYNATRKQPIQELMSPDFASVHSINTFHPTLSVIAGGNSSGRMTLWRT